MDFFSKTELKPPVVQQPSFAVSKYAHTCTHTYLPLSKGKTNLSLVLNLRKENLQRTTKLHEIGVQLLKRNASGDENKSFCKAGSFQFLSNNWSKRSIS